MDKEARAKAITAACDEADCSDESRKRHYALYVEEHWHVHPSAEFKTWWEKHHDCLFGLVPVIPAWNTKRYRDEYMEAREFGTTDMERNLSPSVQESIGVSVLGEA